MLSQPSTSFLVDLDNGLDRIAAGGIGKRLIDLIKIIELDQRVKGKFSGFVVSDKLRDKNPGYGVAFNNADHALSFRHQIVVDIQIHFRRDPDDGADAQRSQGIQRLLDHLGLIAKVSACTTADSAIQPESAPAALSSPQ